VGRGGAEQIPLTRLSLPFSTQSGAALPATPTTPLTDNIPALAGPPDARLPTTLAAAHARIRALEADLKAASVAKAAAEMAADAAADRAMDLALQVRALREAAGVAA
jgi:hypothetical protein